ncbi:unnamed protein product [Arctogadus glacialis]
MRLIYLTAVQHIRCDKGLVKHSRPITRSPRTLCLRLLICSRLTPSFTQTGYCYKEGCWMRRLAWSVRSKCSNQTGLRSPPVLRFKELADRGRCPRGALQIERLKEQNTRIIHAPSETNGL